MKRFTFVLMFASIVTLGAQTPDPVGHPHDYKQFEQVRSMSTKGANPQMGFVMLNKPAATVTTGETRSYPYGSIAVMEWWSIGKDDKGSPVKDKFVRIDVMRKERGYGASYQDARSGEWEYASYGADGKLLTSAAEAKACAACHKKAGEARDFVYAGRFATPQ